MSNKKLIYYLPGRDETHLQHVGSVLAESNIPFSGRDMQGRFLQISFQQQIDKVMADLNDGFIHENVLLIGRSYGGYVLLHTLCEISWFPGRVLLFNPVLGWYINEKQMAGAILPRSGKLMNLAVADNFPIMQSLEIYTGELDKQCDPHMAKIFADSAGDFATVHIISGQGHTLDKNKVRFALFRYSDIWDDLRTY